MTAAAEEKSFDASVFNEWCVESIVKLGSHITDPMVTVQVLSELTKNF